MAVSIVFYEDWMKNQVVELFCKEYGDDPKEFLTFFTQFYEGEYQKNKAIKIVALDNDKVVGFQSFFYWPYKTQDKVYNSLQSGNSLVHPDSRGQGLFRKMLDFAFENQEEKGVDFFIGFPVEASFNSFIRNKWENLFNLQWYIKSINVFSFLTIPFINKEKKLHSLFNTKRKYSTSPLNNHIKLHNELGFNTWRNSYSKDDKYFFLFEKDDSYVEFEVKFNVRRKFIGELIIGNISSNIDDIEVYKLAIKALEKVARKSNVIAIISVALNEECYTIFNRLIMEDFNKIEKRIYFIFKSNNEIDDIKNPQKWDVLRGDIDTW